MPKPFMSDSATEPVLNTATLIVTLALSTPTNLATAITGQAASADLTTCCGLLVSASSGNPVWIGSSTGGGAGKGIKVAADSTLYLPLASWPTDAILYECAGTCSVMLFWP